MAGDLVAPGGNFTNQLWIALRYPSQNKERSVGLMSGEQMENAAGGFFNARRQAGPLVHGGKTSYFTGMKIFFNIYADNIEHVELRRQTAACAAAGIRQCRTGARRRSTPDDR